MEPVESTQNGPVVATTQFRHGSFPLAREALGSVSPCLQFWSGRKTAALPDAMSKNVRRLVCRVSHLEGATPEVWLLRLQSMIEGGLFDWHAGQYASVRFDGQEPRDYSIANRPGEGFAEFHIRHVGGDGASGYVASGLAEGERVEVQGPFGEAWFRRDHPGPVLAVAGGTGLAPMKAVIEDALATGLERDVHLYYGCRDEREIYLERYFIDLARRHPWFRFVSVLSDARPEDDPGRRRGLVGEAVAADFQGLAGFDCYLAGPPPMVDAVMDMLLTKGATSERLFTDAFRTEAEMQALDLPRPVWD